MKRFCLGEIAICIIGLAASLIPFPVYSDPFWGVRTFADQEMFATTSKPGVIVLAVDSGSGSRPRPRMNEQARFPSTGADLYDPLHYSNRSCWKRN